MNRIAVLVAAFLLLSLGHVFAGGAGEAAELEVPQGYSSVSEDGIVLQWKVEGPDLLVRMAAATTGWVSVGFDPSTRMKDSNIIIGYVENGNVFLQDHFGTGGTSHQADEDLGGRDDISAAQGAEENGQTWLSFTIPLDSGDSYDKALQVGNRYDVNLASGRGDDFGSYHGLKRAVVSIEL